MKNIIIHTKLAWLTVKKPLIWLMVLTALVMLIALSIGKLYQHWDNDPDRGALAITSNHFGDGHTTPIYLEQGWSNADSLWFYNTTQGSALLPYDFFLALEQANSTVAFSDHQNIDYYRYLPQKPTFFNPDGLPVGFVKETYQGRKAKSKDYIGYTCAACHTGQINYQGRAIRIDGGPAMADMAGFLTNLEKAMRRTLLQPQKQQRFIDKVIALNNDYQHPEEIIQDLQQWTAKLRLYNVINHSPLHYGYGRLDAFGRIYNRVQQHVLNKAQVMSAMQLTTIDGKTRLLSDGQIQKTLEGIDDHIINDEQFALVLQRLQSSAPGYPGLKLHHLLQLRDILFNTPDAPVNYPYLWDITRSDYVQWNALANNASLGALGRNAGEVIGVFGILDWQAKSRNGFSFTAWLTNQGGKSKHIDFSSSIDTVNLRRLEGHLQSLRSPDWPENILGKIDQEKAEHGRLLYARYCESCHEVINPKDPKRIALAHVLAIDKVKTDPKMAINSVTAQGRSGHFKHTTQSTDVGQVFIGNTAPVLQILTTATKGVIAAADKDKNIIRRRLDQLYNFAASFFQSDMPNTIKQGDYQPDTTAEPYRSLLAYKARPLNGIWATAPYLHNGSVPTLYDLLLPKKRADAPEDGEYRPDQFTVGSREFDPEKVGFISQTDRGHFFDTTKYGNQNTGHEYASDLSATQRRQLLEYLKSL